MLNRDNAGGIFVRASCPSIQRVLAFLLGLSVSTGVVYGFIIGNTPVYIGYCMAMLIFVGLLILCPHGLNDAIAVIDESVLGFGGVAALSLLPSLFYALVGDLEIEAPLTVIKGLIVLFAGIVIYVVAVYLRKERKAVIAGLAVGIIINFLFSLLAQAAFEAGSVFSLISFFPQDAFVVSLQWGVPEPAGSHAIYTFRAQGLFLEPSHLMVFLVAWGLLCVVTAKRIILKAALIIGVAYMSVQAFSPNVAVLILEAILFFLVGRLPRSQLPRSARKRKVSHTAVLATIVVIFALIICIMLFTDSIVGAFGSIAASIADLNIASSADTGTLERFESMLTTLSILPNYPLGSGWNTESVVLTTHFGSSSFASHSFALRLLLESGLLGLGAYCWIIWRHANGVYHVSEQGRFMATAIICMAIAQFINGTTLLPYVWLLLGLARGITEERAEEKGIRRVSDCASVPPMKKGHGDE